MISIAHITFLMIGIFSMLLLLPMSCQTEKCPPFDICFQMGPRLCRNGATCTHLPDNCISCICAPGWTGDHCATAIVTTATTTAEAEPDGVTVTGCSPSHICETHPHIICGVGRHGNCSYEPNNCAKCSCHDGWTGPKCDQEVLSSTTEVSTTPGVPTTTLSTVTTTLQILQPDATCQGSNVCSKGINCSADGKHRLGCQKGWGTVARGCCINCTRKCYDGQCLVLTGNQSGTYQMKCMCTRKHLFVEGLGCRPECEVEPDTQKCLKRTDNTNLFIILGVVTGVALVLFFVFGLVLWIFWKRRNLFALKFVYFLSRFEDNDDLKYDAFLSYKSNGPGDVFVMQELFKKLEKDWGYKVVFHARDFIPGKLIADNILDAVKNSRRVILVLTRDFVESEWCQMEYLSAQQQMLKKKTRIIPLMMEDVTGHPQMDDNLQFILKHVTYLDVPKEDGTEERTKFWDRLRYSMPKRQTDTSPDTEVQKGFRGLDYFKRRSKQEKYIVETGEVISRNNGRSNGTFSADPEANGGRAKLNMPDRKNILPSSREPRSPYQDLPDDLGLVSNEVGDLLTPFPELSIKFPSKQDDGDSGIEYSMTSPKGSPEDIIVEKPNFSQEISL